MTAKELAELVILTLDAQRVYYSNPNRDNLIASKQLEAELRREAGKILSQQTELFT